MSRLTDWKRMRRRYLQKKATGYFVASVFAFCALTLVYIVCIRSLSHGAVTLFLFVFALRFFIKASRRALRQANKIPHVAPVTPQNLPAAEVLVRSAEEPSAPSEMLLRAAGKSEETKAEELLRIASGAMGEQER